MSVNPDNEIVEKGKVEGMASVRGAPSGSLTNPARLYESMVPALTYC